MSVTIRPGRDADAAGFEALIRACWAEYPSIVFDPDELPELGALAAYYANAGGALWAAEDAGGRIVGMIATRPDRDGAFEICRLYVDCAQRGTGLAARLLALAEAHARAPRLVLWSDTRFTRAHRFYEKHSFLRAGPIRALDDRSHSLEFFYARPREGVVALDAAAAASAVTRLAALDPGAEAPWRAAATARAEGRAMLLVAYAEATLAGALRLDLGFPSAAPHRAVLTRLIVAPGFRRRGLARALLAGAEAAARSAGRSLLTAETAEAGAVLRACGWREAGRIPGAGADGADLAILYRPLSDATPAAAG
ncbi:MAG: GNAT family N-acetyltransferase [Rhodospirillales bacterium]|nr:GNAT family N-acetyltransferase [Rhodospirillales bacterium]